MILQLMTKRLPAILLASSLICAPLNSAWAAQSKGEKWYEIEVIVFANTDQSLQESEKWPEKPGTPPTKKVLDLFSTGELLFDDVEDLQMYYVEPFEPNENNLSPLAEKITTSPDYSLLMHRTWRQTAPRKKSSIPVYLDDNLSEHLYQPLGRPEEAEESGNFSAEQLLLEALLAEETNISQEPSSAPFFIHQLDPIIPFNETEGLPSTVETDLSPTGPPNHAVFGTFNFFKSRYLHVKIDFSYRAPPYEPKVEELALTEVFPMAKDGSEESLIDKEQLIKTEEMLSFTSQEKPPYTGFRLKGSKRIRLNEVHYFDHPMFGVIVRAAPYVEPEPEEKESESTDGNS